MEVTYVRDIEPELTDRQKADLMILREAWRTGNLHHEWTAANGIASILWYKASYHVTVEGLQ
jgi:hypothetical protein